jgi:hypothetical protein
MPKDEYFEELKKAHELYEAILEANPPDINKDFKEKYELKSKLFEQHSRDRKNTKIASLVSIIPFLLLAGFLLWLVYKFNQ